MNLFLRRRPATAGSSYDGPSPAAMRGRAAELADAGTAAWEVLWEAMKVEPPNPDAESLTHELGLDWGEQRRYDWAGLDHVRGDRYHGRRHGRQVEVRVQAATRGARATPIQATWVRAATASFTISAAGGAFAISGDGDTTGGAATDLVMSLEPSPAWDHLVLRGGPEGVAAQRRTTMRGQNVGWLYDLWLAERLLGVLDAPALPPLDDLGGRALPYELS